MAFSAVAYDLYGNESLFQTLKTLLRDPLNQLVGLPAERTEHQEKALRRRDDYQTQSQQW